MSLQQAQRGFAGASQGPDGRSPVASDQGVADYRLGLSCSLKESTEIMQMIRDKSGAVPRARRDFGLLLVAPSSLHRAALELCSADCGALYMRCMAPSAARGDRALLTGIEHRVHFILTTGGQGGCLGSTVHQVVPVRLRVIELCDDH